MPNVSKRAFLATTGAVTAGVALSGCGVGLSDLPEADFVLVRKSTRSMSLLRNKVPLRNYRIELGFAPLGHKRQEGDGRTPEGQYFIDRKNPRSNFHLSLGVSYPNRADVARAQAQGVEPGGDIFVHGQRRLIVDKSLPDWTAGCIAVSNREIEEIYAMVRLGTPILILA